MKAENIGFVYVLSNPAIPGLLKIGQSTAIPFRRAMELSSPSGVPSTYRVEFFLLVEDCTKVERLVHDALAMQRLQRGREFFQIELSDAISAIEGIASDAGLFFHGGPMLTKWLALINNRLAEESTEWRDGGGAS